MEQQCSRPDLNGELPFYINGSISSEVEEEIEIHLEHCRECNDDLVFWTLLFEAVINADDVGSASRSIACDRPKLGDSFIRFIKRETSPEQEEDIKRHLVVCTACYNEIATYFRWRREELPDWDKQPRIPRN